MSNRWGVKPEQAEVLNELEKMSDILIPLLERDLLVSRHGVVIKEGNVTGLGIQNCVLTTLPESIGKLSMLQEFEIYRTSLTTLPESIGNLQSLQSLILDSNKLTTLPESIGNLTSLKTLSFAYNQLSNLPESIGSLKSLQLLDLARNKFSSLPESMSNLKSLETLDLAGNNLSTLPEVITKLSSLQSLELYNNEFSSLPESMKNLKSLKELDRGFPESMTNLKSLKELDLGHNKLFTLPETITNLRTLQVLNLRENSLETIPESISNLISLQVLSLRENRLKTIPESIADLRTLETLDLEHNQLTSLPVSMWQLKNLEKISLDYNPWEGDWKELAKRDAGTLRKLLKQKVSIDIFISHTVNEFALYRIKELAEYLEQQPEINQVYYCEEDLRGNIDAWMENTVTKSQLLLFIGTQQSIYNSRDCSNELFLARKLNIEVTPIKGIDASWEDLNRVGLSRQYGFEFYENKFNQLCEELYTYISKLKREKGLHRK